MASPALAPVALSLWTMEVDPRAAPWWREWRASLDHEAAARAARYQRREDEVLFVAAEVLQRAALAAALGRMPCDLRFETSHPHGKPRLIRSAGDVDLRFNRSHCRGLVAVAWGVAIEVGVDVEPEDRVFDDRAARLVLTPTELEGTDDSGGTAARRRRLRAWVRKESAVKATGQGLASELRSFEIRGRPPRPTGGAFGSGRTWCTVDLAPTPQHVLAITAAAPRVRLAWRGLEPSALRPHLRRPGRQPPIRMRAGGY